MTPSTTGPEIVSPDPEGIARACAALRAGKLVGLPTETVYGLAASALDDRAVARIFAAKGRPRFNPLIIHVLDVASARTLVEWDERAESLARAFWPGPLTLVLRRRGACPVSLLASAGLDSLALRVPAHEVARAVLRESEVPIAAPSANRSGGVSPTSAAEVAEELGPAVELILDGGRCAVGVESTVLDLTSARVTILRPGGLPRAAIEREVGPLGPLGPPTGGPSALAGDPALRSPGQLASHYAPRALVRLDAPEVRTGEALLAFGPDVPPGASAVRNLSAAGDLVEAAANLFRMLRELDRGGVRTIAVSPIPDEGLGEAINDRLRRAAAPRPDPGPRG